MKTGQNPNSYALERKLIINQLVGNGYILSNSDKCHEDYINAEKGWEMPEVEK